MVYFGMVPLSIFPDNTVHVTILHIFPTSPHSQEPHDFMRYIPQEQVSCEIVHVGNVSVDQPHQPPHHHPQPPHHHDGADFVVTIKSLVIPQIFKVDLVAELYVEEDVTLFFTVSQLYMVHDVAIKSQVLLI